MGKTRTKAIAELAKSLTSAARAGAARARPSNDETDPLAGKVNSFSASHGDYESYNGRVVNRGGTPVARWKTAGMLSDSQLAAINHCIGLWDAIGNSGGLVANLDRTVFGSPGEGNIREIEARDDLHRIKGYFPDKYYSIFENVVRFDEPAGFAGSRLTECKNDAVAAARTVVQFVADIISMKERLSY